MSPRPDLAALTNGRLIPALTALLLAAPVQADTFVLIHGAWVGEWTWDAVAPLLEAEGHEVVAVSLRGQGARTREAGPDVSVEDHAADIVAVIEAADEVAGEDVILVAHSYGGRPATIAWDRARDRIAHVVYVEALAPLADDAIAIPGDSRSLAFVVTTYPDTADTGMMPPPPTLRDEPGRAHAPMSLKALYGPVSIAAPLPPTPGTYVVAADSSLPFLRQVGEAMRDRRGWDLREVPGGHDVPTDAPAALAAILDEVAAR